MLSVMDHTGWYIFVCVCLGNNDREVFTSSPLYLHEGDFFSDDERVSSNGSLKGGRKFMCSYKDPRNDPIKIRFNLAFHEVTQGVEIAIKESASCSLC